MKKTINSNSDLKNSGTWLTKFLACWQKYFVTSFFVVTWILLAFYESALLERIDAMSLFLCDELFFKNLMSVPAGFLSYIGTFFTQFLCFPVAGATIFVAFLYALYCLTKRVFSISEQNSLLALVPSVLLLALNVQMGYWIFVIKFPGWYFVPFFGIAAAMYLIHFYRRVSWKFSILLVLLVAIFGYPILGVYALLAVLCMSLVGLAAAIKSHNNKELLYKGIIPLSASIALAVAVPYMWYYVYESTHLHLMYTAGLPALSWSIKLDFASSILYYWLPYILLLVTMLLYSVLYGRMSSNEKGRWNTPLMLFVALLSIVFVYLYWYNDNNYRIENKQNNAMWRCDWRDVADFARDTDVPTRTIVLNKNIALLNLGTAGNEMFTYPDGSADIDAPFNVHLTHTCAMMTYFNYGKLNFSYRWCIENSVEYGWKVEYLKHAVRSLIAQREYTLARRYINMLKKTLFHRGWAKDQEKYLDNHDLALRSPEYIVPIQMCCYPDMLEVDGSFIEVYLLKTLSAGTLRDAPPVYDEAVLIATMLRKDKNTFWNAMAAYLSGRKLTRLPKHYQEAVLIYQTLNKSVDASRIPIDKAVRTRFNEFLKRSKKYKGMKEDEMAPFFKDDYSDTYWYFYFFMRGIRSN